MRGLFFLSWQILLPDLLPFDLLVVHFLHLALQLAPAILNVQDFTALQTLLIAEKDVDNEDSNGQPDNKHCYHDSLKADMVDDGQAVFFVYLFIVKFLFDIAVCHFLTDDHVATWTVLCALPESIDIKEGAEDNLEYFPQHVAGNGSKFDAWKDRLKHGDEARDCKYHRHDVDHDDSQKRGRLQLLFDHHEDDTSRS